MKLIYPNNITSVSADTENPNFPADNVLTDHVGEKWKATSTHATLSCYASSGDTIAIFGSNARTITAIKGPRISLTWDTGDTETLSWVTTDTETLSWATYASGGSITIESDTLLSGSRFAWAEYTADEHAHFIELEFDNYGGDVIEVGAVFVGDRKYFAGIQNLQENLIDYSIVFESTTKGVVYIDKDDDDVVRRFVGQVRLQRTSTTDDDYYDFRDLVIRSGRKPIATMVTDISGTEWIVLARLSADLIQTTHDYPKYSLVKFSITEVK